VIYSSSTDGLYRSVGASEELERVQVKGKRTRVAKQRFSSLSSLKLLDLTNETYLVSFQIIRVYQ